MKKEENIMHGPTLEVEVPKVSLGQQIYASLLEYQDLSAVVDGATGKAISYREILHATCSLANALKQRGYSKDSVIAITSENNTHFFKPILASFFLGYTVTLFNPIYKSDEMLHILNISKPSAIFCSQTALKTLLNLQSQMPYVREIIVIDTDEDVNNVKSLNNYIRNQPDTFQPVRIEQCNEVGLLLYSSGTTGHPKGVMLTERNLSSNLAIYRDARYYKKKTTHQEVHIILAPTFHIFGLAPFLRWFTFGFKIIMQKRYNEELFLTTIQKYKVSRLQITPTLGVMLVKSPLLEKYDLTSVECIFTGGSPLNLELETLLKQKFPTVKYVQQGYGLTETATLTAFMAHESKSGSCGRLAPNTMGKVVDKNGQTIPPNHVGELCFKSNTIMKGYAGDIESTRQILDENGWLSTGDRGYFDKDGYVYVIDRQKELIKYRGYQVPPAELESVLLTHPNILEAAVVGVPHETDGELPCAFIVRKAGSALTESEVKKHVQEKLSPIKWLRGGVRFIEEIPQTSSGKMLKRVLKERYLSKYKL